MTLLLIILSAYLCSAIFVALQVRRAPAMEPHFPDEVTDSPNPHPGGNPETCECARCLAVRGMRAARTGTTTTRSEPARGMSASKAGFDS